MGAKDVFGRAGNNLKIPLEMVVLAPNVRRTIPQETLAELANSLHLEGQRTAGKGYLHDDGEHFVVTAGQRRYRAMLYANENLGCKFEVIVCDIEAKVNGKNPSGAELKFRQLADQRQEKICSEDEAAAIKSLIEEDGCNVIQVAERLRCSQQHIRNMLKFDSADEGIKTAVRSGQMSATTAVKTARATDDVQREVKEKLDRGEKVRGIDLAEPTKRLTDDQVRAQIRKADAAFCREATVKGQMKYKGMVEAFRITLGEADLIK